MNGANLRLALVRNSSSDIVILIAHDLFWISYQFNCGLIDRHIGIDWLIRSLDLLSIVIRWFLGILRRSRHHLHHLLVLIRRIMHNLLYLLPIGLVKVINLILLVLRQQLNHLIRVFKQVRLLRRLVNFKVLCRLLLHDFNRSFLGHTNRNFWSHLFLCDFLLSILVSLIHLIFIRSLLHRWSLDELTARLHWVFNF